MVLMLSDLLYTLLWVLGFFVIVLLWFIIYCVRTFFKAIKNWRSGPHE